MLKAILSRKNLTENSEYYSYVRDLLTCSDVKSLREHPHHIGTSRFQHSLNVSYYNFKLCRLFHLDAKAAARAGLLHDLFFYDRKTHEKIRNRHCAEHANIALYNASMRFSISELEGDMILNHMWPMTPHLPRHAETYMITLVDKFCASAELTAHLLRILGSKIRKAEKFAEVRLCRCKIQRRHTLPPQDRYDIM